MKSEKNQLNVNRLHPHLGNIYYELEDEKEDGKYNIAPRRMRTIHLQSVPYENDQASSRITKTKGIKSNSRVMVENLGS